VRSFVAENSMNSAARNLPGTNTTSNQQPTDVPLVIHCSAGIGRTGTFVLLDASLNLIEAKKSLDAVPDLAQLLICLRKCRMGLVQTFDQLRFCFHCVNEEGKRLIPPSEFSPVSIRPMPETPTVRQQLLLQLDHEKKQQQQQNKVTVKDCFIVNPHSKSGTSCTIGASGSTGTIGAPSSTNPTAATDSTNATGATGGTLEAAARAVERKHQQGQREGQRGQGQGQGQRDKRRTSKNSYNLQMMDRKVADRKVTGSATKKATFNDPNSATNATSGKAARTAQKQYLLPLDE